MDTILKTLQAGKAFYNHLNVIPDLDIFKKRARKLMNTKGLKINDRLMLKESRSTKGYQFLYFAESGSDKITYENITDWNAVFAAYQTYFPNLFEVK